MSQKNLDHFFKTHPEAKEVHETSDGLLFIVKDNAIAHANDIARGKTNVSRSVKTIEKGEKIAEAPKAETEEEKADKAAKAEAAEKASAAKAEKAEANKKAKATAAKK